MNSETPTPTLTNEDFTLLHQIVDEVQKESRKKRKLQNEQEKIRFIQEQAVAILEDTEIPDSSLAVQRQMNILNPSLKFKLTEKDYASLFVTEEQEQKQIEELLKTMNQDAQKGMFSSYAMQNLELMFDQKNDVYYDSMFLKTMLYFYSSITKTEQKKRNIFEVLTSSLLLCSTFSLTYVISDSIKNGLHNFYLPISIVVASGALASFNWYKDRNNKLTPIETKMQDQIQIIQDVCEINSGKVGRVLNLSRKPFVDDAPNTPEIVKFLQQVSRTPMGHHILKNFKQNNKKIKIFEIVLLGMAFPQFITPHLNQEDKVESYDDDEKLDKLGMEIEEDDEKWDTFEIEIEEDDEKWDKLGMEIEQGEKWNNLKNP